ncbi:glycosyltransferase, partial [Streptomyces sp. A7024]
TLARPCLTDCLGALAAAKGPKPREIVLVDDRPRPEPADLEPALTALGDLRARSSVLHSGGRGPAAARNAGWSTAGAPWTVFVDDDVQVGPRWYAELADDLAAASPDVGGVQGTLHVPLPRDRRATDWERSSAGLARALWVTADMAYRTEALKQVGGFDERFPRAFRKDADLALRVLDAGRRIRRGSRLALRPVRPAGRWASVVAQAGNADDALMRRLHGPGWRGLAAAPRGRIRVHMTITALGVLAAAGLASGRRGLGAVAGTGWAAGTAEFAWARIAPGPRTPGEITTMALTSLLIPPAATWHRLTGELRHRRVRPWSEIT